MIRKMESRDLEQVAELEKVCFSEAWSWKLLEAGIHSPYDVYYVFEQDEQILGYCNLRILAGEGEIQRIAVLPPFRRLGVARKLMDAMVDFAVENKAAAVTLEVQPETCMNPMVLRQRQSGRGITEILLRTR